MDSSIEVIQCEWAERYDLTSAARCFQIGPFLITLRAQQDELWVQRNNQSTWFRYVLGEPVSTVRFTPLFPDKAVVVRPGDELVLSPQAKASMYIQVPLWIAIEIGQGDPKRVLELPSVELSYTWNGSFEAGELCYWLSSGVQREAKPQPANAHLAICPIEVVNDSTANLTLPTIQLACNLFRLYGKEGQLWSSSSQLIYRSNDHGPEVNVSADPPPEVQGALIVSVARRSPDKGFAARTLKRFLKWGAKA